MQGYTEAFAEATAYETACANAASAECTTFINDKTKEFEADQKARKDNTMSNTMFTLQRVSDADLNSAIGLIRTQDINALQNAIDSSNGLSNDAINHDLGLTKRQFEINEYHYYNKLDTLFFLQLFFIAALVMAILIYFNRRGLLTTQMTGILTALLAVILIIMGISRYFYTIRTRDRRLWHRRYFKTEKDPGGPLLSNCPGPSATPLTVDLNAIFDNTEVQCAIETSDEFDKWKKATNKEIENQINKSVMPASIFAPSGFTVSSKCRKR